MIRTRLRPPARLFLVTFDLTSTVPGDARYRAADSALEGQGEVFRPVKQVRLVITRSSPARLKASVVQRVGRAASILIVPITAMSAWHIYGRGKPRAWREFVAAVEAADIAVEGLSADIDGPD